MRWNLQLTILYPSMANLGHKIHSGLSLEYSRRHPRGRMALGRRWYTVRSEEDRSLSFW